MNLPLAEEILRREAERFAGLSREEQDAEMRAQMRQWEEHRRVRQMFTTQAPPVAHRLVSRPAPANDPAAKQIRDFWPPSPSYDDGNLLMFAATAAAAASIGTCDFGGHCDCSC